LTYPTSLSITLRHYSMWHLLNTYRILTHYFGSSWGFTESYITRIYSKLEKRAKKAEKSKRRKKVERGLVVGDEPTLSLPDWLSKEELTVVSYATRWATSLSKPLVLIEKGNKLPSNPLSLKIVDAGRDTIPGYIVETCIARNPCTIVDDTEFIYGEQQSPANTPSLYFYMYTWRLNRDGSSPWLLLLMANIDTLYSSRGLWHKDQPA